MTDMPSPEDPQPNPEIVAALVSIDPYLSDFKEGALVDHDGQPLHPVAAIEIRYASPADFERANLIDAARQDQDRARYEDIARLTELTRSHWDLASPLADILAKMPAAERAEAENILGRLPPGRRETAASDSKAREDELFRLRVVHVQAQQFIDSNRLRLVNGKPVLDPETGEPLPDPYATLDALDVMQAASNSESHLLGYRVSAVPATAAELGAKLDELEKRYPLAAGNEVDS